MKALLYVLTALFVSAVHLPADAVMYRADGRRPEVVFTRGFAAWGTNKNLHQHVGGQTCNLGNVPPEERANGGSAYISLAATLPAAIEVARGRLRQARPTAQDPEPTIWMYEIRPTDTVYNAALTYERAGVNLVAPNMRAAYQNVLTLEEWDDTGPVAPERIRSATQYRLVNGQAQEIVGTGVTNPLYVERPTAANPNPLPPSVITGVETLAQRTRAAIGSAATGLMSACWCNPSLGGGRPQRSIVEDPIDACQENIQIFNDVVPRVRYFPSDGWEVNIS